MRRALECTTVHRIPGIRYVTVHLTFRRELPIKFASGSNNPADLARSGTFDQLYPANHDKFGHQDLLGWRNLHNASSKGSYALTRNFSGNVLYSSFWLASLRDSLYSGSGKAISRSAAGTAGRHAGQKLDGFVTYKYRHFLIGVGYGYFFKGEFVRNTTPGVNSSYVYLFHTTRSDWVEAALNLEENIMPHYCRHFALATALVVAAVSSRGRGPESGTENQSRSQAPSP